MDATVMGRFWERMTAIFGARWSSIYGLVPEGVYRQEWELTLSQMIPEQINRSLLTCRSRSDGFAPTPGEFRLWGLGCPSVEDVRNQMAGPSDARTPFVLDVMRRLDLWALKHADSRTADRMVRDAYNATRDALIRGEELPPAPLELPAPKPETRTFTIDEGKRWIADIEALLGTSPVAKRETAADVPWDEFVADFKARALVSAGEAA